MRVHQFSRPSSTRPASAAGPSTSFRIRNNRITETAAVVSDAEFWRRRLAEVPLTLDLPIALPGARATGVSCATEAFEAPDWLTAKLHKIAQDEVVSIFTVVLSAWEVLLFRYSGQEEFVVGCSTPKGRGSFPFQPGLVHASLSARMSFTELVRLNARRRAESVAHDGANLDALVSALGTRLDRERHPAFQTAVIQRQYMSDRHSSAVQKGTYAPCELVCVFQDGVRAIRGRIEYPSGIVAPEHSARLATHFLNVLRAAASLPNAPLSSLPFRTPEELLAPVGGDN